MGAAGLAVIDEHEIFRRGLLATVKQDPSLDVVHAASGGSPPNAAQLVIASPQTARQLPARVPRVICWGPSDPPLRVDDRSNIVMLERDRVSGEQLLAAVRALRAGLRVACDGHGTTSDDDLDARSVEILRLLAEGLETREISSALNYADRTIKGRIHQLEEKLAARNRAELVAKAIRLGLI